MDVPEEEIHATVRHPMPDYPVLTLRPGREAHVKTIIMLFSLARLPASLMSKPV